MPFRARDFKSPASAIPPPARDAMIVPLWRSLVKRAPADHTASKCVPLHP